MAGLKGAKAFFFVLAVIAFALIPVAQIFGKAWNDHFLIKRYDPVKVQRGDWVDLRHEPCSGLVLIKISQDLRSEIPAPKLAIDDAFLLEGYFNNVHIQKSATTLDRNDEATYVTRGFWIGDVASIGERHVLEAKNGLCEIAFRFMANSWASVDEQVIYVSVYRQSFWVRHNLLPPTLVFIFSFFVFLGIDLFERVSRVLKS